MNKLKLRVKAFTSEMLVVLLIILCSYSSPNLTKQKRLFRILEMLQWSKVVEKVRLSFLPDKNTKSSNP